MARLNIEEKFWLDIGKVAVKMGSYDLAIGNAIRMFRFAQDRYKHGKIISEDDWTREEFHVALVGTFVDKVDGGYEVRGAEKFDWLKERASAGRNGGVKSGETRRNDFNKLAEAKRSKPKQTEASSSYSPSSSKEEIKNSSFKNLDYGDAARRLLSGIKSYGPDDSEKLQTYLGPQTWAAVQRAGGVRHFRTMKDDQWLLTNVTKILAATKT